MPPRRSRAERQRIQRGGAPATLAKHYKVASPQELLETAIDMGVKLVPCQMTMDLMGLTKDDLIEGIEEPAGATSALAAAEGATTLFI
jgi:peroxiredoxin family protein